MTGVRKETLGDGVDEYLGDCRKVPPTLTLTTPLSCQTRRTASGTSRGRAAATSPAGGRYGATPRRSPATTRHSTPSTSCASRRCLSRAPTTSPAGCPRAAAGWEQARPRDSRRQLLRRGIRVALPRQGVSHLKPPMGVCQGSEKGRRRCTRPRSQSPRGSGASSSWPTIVDRYMGSGTTGIAAARRRRRMSTDRRGIAPDLPEWAGWRAE
jgi:hypothetical protein